MTLNRVILSSLQVDIRIDFMTGLRPEIVVALLLLTPNRRLSVFKSLNHLVLFRFYFNKKIKKLRLRLCSIF